MGMYELLPIIINKIEQEHNIEEEKYLNKEFDFKEEDLFDLVTVCKYTLNKTLQRLVKANILTSEPGNGRGKKTTYHLSKEMIETINKII